jgi:hypothetical protein
MSTPTKVDHSKKSNASQIVKALNPNIDEKKLQQIVSKIETTVNAISSSSSSLAEFSDKKESLLNLMRNSSGDHSQIFSTLAKFKEKQVEILKENELTVDSPSSPEIDLKIEKAAVQSVQEVNVQPTAPKQKCGVAGCEKTENLKRCSRCKKMMYCSGDCQKLDWNRHKDVCRL